MLGKAIMNELGVETGGINPHHRATMTPYCLATVSDIGRRVSGIRPAIYVGLCPVSLSAD
jgi:hypothetical protein